MRGTLVEQAKGGRNGPSLDLVTFQDHPTSRVPRHLDADVLRRGADLADPAAAPTWTNLPLRHPAVLARSVAGLDQLSGGRIELGIGAGGFWDAIEAA